MGYQLLDDGTMPAPQPPRRLNQGWMCWLCLGFIVILLGTLFNVMLGIINLAQLSAMNNTLHQMMAPEALERPSSAPTQRPSVTVQPTSGNVTPDMRPTLIGACPGFIINDDTVLKTGPGPAFETLATLPKGMGVAVIEHDTANSWTKVYTGNDVGWVFRFHVQQDDPGCPVPTSIP